tara:strand:+ start:19117 stop:19578 length:462 start_codon:yes stop_codon:yes gene_type:complete
MQGLRSIRAFCDRHIDYRGAIVGAVVLGTIVLYVNLDHGLPSALVAAGKQATYTFFAGGYMVRLNERIALALEPAWFAVLAATLGAGGLAVGLTFLVHSLRGTPEPVNSTLPTLVLASLGFILLGALARRERSRAAPVVAQSPGTADENRSGT